MPAVACHSKDWRICDSREPQRTRRSQQGGGTQRSGVGGAALAKITEAMLEESLLCFLSDVVGKAGFEPAISRSRTGRDTRLRYFPK